ATAGRLVLGDLVVELLPDGERAGQLATGLLQRLLATGDGVGAEVRAGEVDVDLDGAHPLVEVEQRLAGPAVERLGRGAGVRVRRPDLRRLLLGPVQLLLAPRAAGPEEHVAAAGDQHE